MEHLPYTVSSESVSEGHPDKVCDYIADSVLDAYIAQDKKSHVACEVMCKNNFVILGGEISSKGRVNYEELVRKAVIYGNGCLKHGRIQEGQRCLALAFKHA